MSSHHIVREKQEPALLVLSTEHFSDELFGQLLEWSPTIIATGLMAEKLHSEGIKVDWILTNEHTDFQSDAKILHIGDGPQIKAAMDFLTRNGYPSVNIVTSDADLSDYQGYVNLINLVVYSGNNKIYPVRSGFAKWKPAGEVVEVLTQDIDLQADGLEKIGPNQYQTIADGMFTLRFSVPFIFISEGL
jgi:thiamine pyrophosphokinase